MTVIQKLNKPMVLLLAVFCLNMAYCALYKITSNDVNNKETFVKQPKSLAGNSIASACSLNEATKQISVAEIERSAAIDFFVIGILLCTFITSPASVRADFLKPFQDRSRYPISAVPLFVQYGRLII